MLPVSISSFRSDELSVELLASGSLINSSSFNFFISWFLKASVSDLFFFLTFAFISFFLLQSLQHRFLRNNLNKNLHHCTVTNCKSYCRVIINILRRLYMYTYIIYTYTRQPCPNGILFFYCQMEGKISSSNIKS